MTNKTKQNLLTFIFAILVFMTLVFGMARIWGAALGTAFFAFLIWNNKLRKNNKSTDNTDSNSDNSTDNESI